MTRVAATRPAASTPVRALADLGDVLAGARRVRFSAETAWRVEVYGRKRRNGQRAAYFQYRRGSGRNREARYGGSFAVLWKRHPARARAFLRRASWVPSNLPQEALEWLETQRAIV